MKLSQLIYTSTCTNAMTPKMAYQVSVQSVSVCQQLGLTGRVFANNQQALAITEGPSELVRRYYQAVCADVLVETMILHTDRDVSRREFSDYSVWLNLGTPMTFTGTVRHLSAESLKHAMPEAVSGRIRVMIEAYLKPNLLAA